MAKIDLTSWEWREFVFQGKNKGYGAYIMRSESAKRHNRAMLIVAIFAIFAFSVPTLIKLAIPEQKEVMVDVTKLSQLDKPEEKPDEKIHVPEPPPELKSSIKFTAPVIKKDEEVVEEDEIKSQEEVTKADVAVSIEDIKGTNEETGKLIEEVTQVSDDHVYESIEQMPQYPCGEKELLKFIGANLRYPSIAAENGVQGKVTVQFVVGKTGEISHIEVVRPLDPACDKEAIRVVKLLPKFIPGKQNGVNVNVRYSLPITFRLQQ